MSCTYRNRAETVLAYVRQELNPEAQEAFEAHYFICEECASEVLFYEKAVLTMQGQGGLVFVQPKQQSVEISARIHHFLNRVSKNPVWRFGEGGAVRALAGYAILIVFLSASSLGLMKLVDDPSTTDTRQPRGVIAASNLGISYSTSSGNKTAKPHVDWPQNLKLSEDAALLTQLERLRKLYQSQKDYASADKAFSELPEALLHTEEVQLFLAVCEIHEHKNAAAELRLASIMSQPNFAYRHEVETLLSFLSKK